MRPRDILIQRTAGSPLRAPYLASLVPSQARTVALAARSASPVVRVVEEATLQATTGLTVFLREKAGSPTAKTSTPWRWGSSAGASARGD